MTDFIPTIPDLTDAALAARLQSALDNKTKPQGALGRLETLALRECGIREVVEWLHWIKSFSTPGAKWVSM